MKRVWPSAETALLLGIIGLGILLRFTDNTVWDVLSDEAQFLLGHSNSHADVVPFLLRSATDMCGGALFCGRALAGLAGVLTLGALYWLGTLISSPRQALMMTGLAAMWPMHIAMNRIGYLDSFQALGWVTVTAVFLQTRRTPTATWLLLLYISVLATTFMKTQGFLFPLFLGVGLVIAEKQRIIKNPIAYILLLAALPAGAFIFTEPQIVYALTVLKEEKIAGFNPARLLKTFDLWWRYLLPFLPFGLVSLPWLRRCPWEVWLLCGMSVVLPFLFGPDHKYYVTYTVFWAIPAGLMLGSLRPLFRTVAVIVVTVAALFMVGPRAVMPHAYLLPFTREVGYWNRNADKINALLAPAETVYVSGATHHMRWYLEPVVIPMDNLTSIENIRGTILVSKRWGGAVPNLSGLEEIYADDEVVILKR